MNLENMPTIGQQKDVIHHIVGVGLHFGRPNPGFLLPYQPQFDAFLRV